MGKIETYTQWAISIADDNSHGYSQANRTGNPDYDCSSLVSGALKQAGFNVGWLTTWTLDTTLPTIGFTNVTSSVTLTSGAGLQRGDILLNTNAHVAIYIGDGQLVHARSAEGSTQSGDQSGNEIRTQAYWNYPWNKVYRYTGDDTSTSTSSSLPTMSVSLPLIKPTHQTQSITAVKTICSILNRFGLYSGTTVDKYNTTLQSATKLMQAHFGLTQDAEWGTNTWLAGITKAW